MAADHDYEIPEDCHYTESDEWVRVDGQVVRVGITDYAQSELNDIVFVELPETGSQLEVGQAFGVVESVKAVSDLLAPIAGEVTEVHARLSEHPEWLNEDPYGRGWIIAITPEDLDALDGLLSAADYRAHVKARSGK
jgi:glycine cleavage system H protein